MSHFILSFYFNPWSASFLCCLLLCPSCSPVKVDLRFALIPGKRSWKVFFCIKDVYFSFLWSTKLVYMFGEINVVMKVYFLFVEFVKALIISICRLCLILFCDKHDLRCHLSWLPLCRGPKLHLRVFWFLRKSHHGI